MAALYRRREILQLSAVVTTGLLSGCTRTSTGEESHPIFVRNDDQQQHTIRVKVDNRQDETDFSADYTLGEYEVNESTEYNGLPKIVRVSVDEKWEKEKQFQAIERCDRTEIAVLFDEKKEITIKFTCH